MNVIYIDNPNITIDAYPNINLCIGYFDGVHLGHASLIKKALDNGPTGVMTFDVQPRAFLNKNKDDKVLTSLEDKNNLLSAMGVEVIYVLKTSYEILNLSKDEFITNIIKKINPVKIFVGEDFKFGRNAEGTSNYLSKFFNTEIINLKKDNDNKISSREIEELIVNGEIQKANRLLGHPYTVSGIVIHGKQNGIKIGFPTANYQLNASYVMPKLGVYSGYSYYKNKKYKSVISVSTHPTIMELNTPIIEVHLLDFDEVIYGEQLITEFHIYIRGIFRFNNLEELKSQIENDKQFTKNALK